MQALRPDQFNPHQTGETRGQEAECGFGHLAQLFSLGAIHLSLVVAFRICSMAAYVLATFGTHYISLPSSHFPSLLVSCMSVHSSILFPYIAVPALCPLCSLCWLHVLPACFTSSPYYGPLQAGVEFLYVLQNVPVDICVYTHTCFIRNRSYSITEILTYSETILLRGRAHRDKEKLKNCQGNLSKHCINPNLKQR